MYWSFVLVVLVPPAGGDGDVDGAGVPAGAVAVMVVSFVTGERRRRRSCRTSPRVAPVKFVPVMVTVVPPVVGPGRGAHGGDRRARGGGGPAVIETFWTWWMSLNPPVAPVNPTSTYGGSDGRVVEHLRAVHRHGQAGRRSS